MMRALSVRLRVLPICVLAGSFAFAAACRAQDTTTPQPLPHVSLHPDAPAAQDTPAATPAPAATQPEQQPASPATASSPADAGQPALQPDGSSKPAATDAQPTLVPVSATPGSTAPVKGDGYIKDKKGKEIYTGPTDIIVLAPTPMLDEEGKQRVDPDGKPMFNPPVKQQRDKRGHPLFDEHGKPVFQTATELGYDEHGKKLHSEKEKAPKMTPMSVSRGTFTVDGVIGKAELNYTIADFKYLYFYVPGVGVTVISNEPFPGASQQQNAFKDNTVTVKVDDHVLQLASDKNLLGKKPEVAYVLVNREFKLPSKFPVVGYGTLRVAPYQWPGSRPNEKLADVVAPPPIPVDLRPVMLLSPCPKGQMRKPAPPVLPGQTAPPQPCVPIAQVQAAMKAKSAATFAVSAAPASSTAKPAKPVEASDPPQPQPQQ